jgi:hypothetical protein
MIFIARRLAAIAVAAQVGQNDSEVFGQFWRNFMPADMSLGIPVQQQKRRPVSGHARVDGNFSNINLAMIKITQQHGSCWDASLPEPVHSNLKLDGVDAGVWLS